MRKAHRSIRNSFVISATALALAVGGCANMTETQQDTAKGAGAGAVIGGVLGAVVDSHHRGQGAAIGAAIGGTIGGVGANIWSRKMQEQKAAMEAATAGTGVGVTQTANNELKLDIPSDISFDTGKSAIKPEMRPILDKFAKTLVDNPATNLRIIGHTDNTGSDKINNPLSLARADSARDYLTARNVAPARIETAGHGDREPVADNTSAEGRAKNRRIEIFVAEPAPAAAAPAPEPAAKPAPVKGVAPSGY